MCARLDRLRLRDVNHVAGVCVRIHMEECMSLSMFFLFFWLRRGGKTGELRVWCVFYINTSPMVGFSVGRNVVFLETILVMK